MKLASKQGSGPQPQHAPPSNYASRNPVSRVERLLRERELRRSNRVVHHDDDDTDGVTSENEQRAGASGEWISADEDRILDAAVAAVRASSETREARDGRPLKQRLLVVANRLPVSAVRRGEDSWSLEISAGGLVSALLGE